MKKKSICNQLVAMGLVICTAFSFAACGVDEGNKNGTTIDTPVDPNTKDLTEKWTKDAIYCFTDEVYATEGYDAEKVNKNITEFGLRVFEESFKYIEHGSSNILVSPSSIIAALGMTTFGMREDTLKQTEEAFGIGRGYLNYYNSNYLNDLSAELKIANSIWFTNDDRLTVKDEFLQFNDEFYHADLYETAFDNNTLNSINKWVEEKTDGMIKNILDKIPERAVMYLINALAFEAEWEKQYKERQLLEDVDFRASTGEVQKVDMMCSDEYYYLEDDNATGFIKYYKGRKYAFVALLPNQGITVEEYAKTLNGGELYDMLANPIDTLVDAQIPQFSYEYSIQMNDALKELGITDAFDPEKADFTNMAESIDGNIYISRVIHKTFIDVNPAGTRAGAATVIELEDAGYFPQEHKEVHLNRPFLYMIIDCDTLTPVFIGAVNEING